MIVVIVMLEEKKSGDIVMKVKRGGCEEFMIVMR
jgi:hypothetical protein